MKVVVCDLDGGIANTKHRDYLLHKKDWERYNKACRDDAPVRSLIAVLNGLALQGYVVVLLSGRSNAVRDETVEWLMENGVSYHHLLLRAADNRKPNDKFKMDLINAFLKSTGATLEFVIEPFQKTARAWLSHPHKPTVLITGELNV